MILLDNVFYIPSCGLTSRVKRAPDVYTKGSQCLSSYWCVFQLLKSGV